MDRMFFYVKNEESEELSSSQKEDSLLEIVVPTKCDDKTILEYIKSLGKEEYNEIVYKQNKAKEVFRKKVNKIIKKCKEKFKLPFVIYLRIPSKPKKLIEYNLESHGIIFEGNISISVIFQYFSEELIEKIIRYLVYMIACEYERKVGLAKDVMFICSEYPDGEIKNVICCDELEEGKYHVVLGNNEIQEIKSDYELAIKQISSDMKNRPIMSV